MKIAIIGAGNMGGALARGLARGTKVAAEDIWLSDLSYDNLANVKNEFPAIASLISGWVAKLWIQHAMMWADGTRTAAEILNLVRRSGFDIAPELFAELLKFMESEGYLRFQK